MLSDTFEHWLDRLRDVRARIKIVAKIRSMSAGNFGDVKVLGDRLWEVRIHYGPGYRLYYVRESDEVYLLLIGGDKASQEDIAAAKNMAAAQRIQRKDNE